MEKIQFKDLPNMTTPLSSANLNQMQDNMENAIVPIKLVSISDTAPASATIGDMYYNTTDNKIYTATADNTWDNGSTPRYDGFYVNMETNLMYYYNGTSLIKSGGDIAPSVKNEKTTSETDVYSCNYINNLSTYTTSERKVGKWIDGNDLYEKVIHYDSLPSGKTTTRALYMNASNIKYMSGTFLNSGYLNNINQYVADNNYHFTVDVNPSGNMRLQVGSSLKVTDVNIIIRYIKTS